MGQLTRAQIVTRGLELAGRTNLTTQANVWLNAWLRETYRSWTWPFLHKRLAGVSLASGTTSLSFGAGAGGETLEVPHIYDPLRIYTSNKSIRSNVRVRSVFGGDPTMDDDLVDEDNQVGTPELVRIRPDTSAWGKWALKFYPIPNQTFLLALDYIVQPADIDTTSGGDDEVPIYPNDGTMIQAVLVAAMKYLHKYEEAAQADGDLGNMKAGDKVRYGMSPGLGTKLELDSRYFRKGNSGLGGGRSGW